METAPAVLLIVEDDPHIREALFDLLRHAGYAVECAADGAAGLARIEAGGIDLVLLDLMLPVLDGLELCRRVRARADEVYLPILMITALGSEAQRRNGYLAGADDYIVKPFDFSELLDRVQAWARARERIRAGVERRREQELVAQRAEDRAQSLDERTRAFRALHEVAVAAGGVLDPGALGRLAVDHARDVLGVDSAALVWWDGDAGALRRLADNSRDTQLPALLQPGERAPGVAFQRREPVIVEDYPSSEHAIPAAVASGLASLAAVPLQVGDRAVGALAVRTYRPHHFTTEEVQFLSLLAAQVAPALEAARLYAESERRRVEAEALAELVRQGTAERDTDRLIGLITEQACRLVRADYAALGLVQPDGTTALHGMWGNRSDAWRAGADRFPLGKGHAGLAMTQGHTVILERLGDNPELAPEEFPIHLSEGGRTALATPLRGRDGALGALVLGWRSDVTVTPAQMHLAEALASHAATVIDNARAHAREQQLAREAAERAGALAASEEQLRTLHEALACGVLVRDAAGQIVQANRAAEEILGLLFATMRGRRTETLWESTHEDGSPLSATERQEMVAQVVRTRRPMRKVTRRLTRPDGQRCWLQIDTVPVFGPNGEVLQVVSSFIDITARKQAERQLQALAQSDKLRALGQMASGVAHDLNQYLGLVAGHGDLALRALSSPAPDLDSVRDSLHVVVQAAMDGGETVKRLLTFARQRQESPAVRVDLAELLREVARLTAPQWRDAAQAEGRPIKLHVESDGDVTIEGWPESVREAFTNLLLNAVDALPMGGQITLSAQQADDHVAVEVADSGTGMTPDVLAHVFEPFFSTKGERGTGLGLAMVYGIVERHGGTIDVESTPGQGTRFRLVFPAAAGTAAAAPPPTTPIPGPSRRVLAVDDEPAVVNMIARMLVAEGHSVVTALSGEEALARLAAEPFDLVISDIGMGAGMNGWELAQRVRERHPGIDFVLATGWGAEIDPAQATAQGVQALIAKPYRMADLKRVIGSL